MRECAVQGQRVVGVGVVGVRGAAGQGPEGFGHPVDQLRHLIGQRHGGPVGQLAHAAQARAQRVRHPAQRARVVGVRDQQVHQGLGRAALLVLGVEADGAVKQVEHGVKTSLLADQPQWHGFGQGPGQKLQAFDVAANGQQTPAVVTAHAVGLGTGECGQHLAGVGQQALHGHGIGRAGMGVGTEEPRLGLFEQAPVFRRQAFAHRGGGQANGAQIEADAGGQLLVPQACNERALEHTMRLCGGGHTNPHQTVARGHAGDEVEQARQVLVFAAQNLQAQAHQTQGVFGALGVTAHPEQVFCGAAGDQALAVGRRHVRAGQWGDGGTVRGRRWTGLGCGCRSSC